MASARLRGGHRHAVVLVLCLAGALSACAGEPESRAPESRAPESRAPESRGPVPVPEPAAYAEQLVEKTNETRVELGLEPLAKSSCAAEIARQRAEELVGQPLEHAPLTGVGQACTPGGSRVAENLVNSASSPAEVLEAWMASPGHRNNIVDPDLTRIGIGCVSSDKGLLCSQLFLGE